MQGQTVTLTALDGPGLAESLRAGIYRVFARADHLNKINVFPVPDGDTGTNLAMTLHTVLLALDREPPVHAGALLARIADAAIDGSRGNSGAILAQFLLGLGDRAGPLAALSAQDLAAAARTGATYARDALTEPREGTLLTVLEDFASSLERLVDTSGARDFRELLPAALEDARLSLAGTTERNEALRAAGVVDAGAEGFVDLLEGVTSWCVTGEVGEPVRPTVMADEPMAFGEVATDHRYCTECVITADRIDQRHLREVIAAAGSSLVVAGSQRKVRVHVHTNDPESLFRTAAQFGSVTAQKADDMLRQAAAAHHGRSRRVAVVTDSAADLPDDASERYELQMVPVRVHFGSRSYLDKVSLSPEEFYAEIVRSPVAPTTSQPPPGDFRRMYEFLTSHYESVVSIALTAKVSGTCNAARTAANRMPEGRVAVIDSLNASIGQGQLAIYAAECAQAGFTGAETAAATQRMIPRTRTFALLLTVEHAVRGGRVPRFMRPMARLLRLSPIIATFPDGTVRLAGTLFGRHDLRRRYAAFIRRQLKAGARWRIAVGHTADEPTGRALLGEIIAGRDDVESSWMAPLGPALGAHGGPGMLVVGIQDYVPPARE